MTPIEHQPQGSLGGSSGNSGTTASSARSTGGRHPGYGFGDRERTLFEFLRNKARKKTRASQEQPLWVVVQRVYGRAADRRSTRRWLTRLRQLQYAVNRKLARIGDDRRILASRPGYLILDLLRKHPRRPKKIASATGLSVPSSLPETVPPPKRRGCPGLEVTDCEEYLLRCLARGICQSRELEKRCCQVRGFSRCVYFAARRRLQLQAVKRGLTGPWEVHLPVPEANPEDNSSQDPGSDPLR